jgi:hypothetical protein
MADPSSAGRDRAREAVVNNLPSEPIDPAHRAAITEGLAQIRRGELATMPKSKRSIAVLAFEGLIFAL